MGGAGKGGGPGCGNGVKEGSEECDGSDLGGADCTTALSPTLAKGLLTCSADCNLLLDRCVLECPISLTTDGWSQYGRCASRQHRSDAGDGPQSYHVKWSLAQTAGTGSTVVFAPSGSLLFGSSDFKLHAVDPATHKEIWSYATSAAINATPAVGSGGTVFIGSTDGYFYAIAPSAQNDAGTLLWKSPVMGAVYSSAAIGADGTVYVGSDDGSLYAFEPTMGATLWSYKTGGPIRSSPAIGPDGTVYVASEDSQLYALTLGPTTMNGGKVKWTNTSYASSWSQSGAATLVAYKADGSLLWQSTDADPKITATVTASPTLGLDGTIYIGSAVPPFNLYAIGGP